MRYSDTAYNDKNQGVSESMDRVIILANFEICLRPCNVNLQIYTNQN